MISRERASVVRGGIMDLRTKKVMSFFMQPPEITTAVTVNWTKQQALGASYERMHYRGTSNLTFSLEVTFNRIVYAESFRTMQPPAAAGRTPVLPTLAQSSLELIKKQFMDHRNFLLSLCYPTGNVRDVLRRSPPHCLLIWPRLMAMRVVMTTLSIRDSEFSNDGESVSFTASCTFEEYRTYRLTSREVRAFGTIRRTGVGEGA